MPIGLDFRVLGPLTVLHEGGPLKLGGTIPRAILALLLIRRNRVVTNEDLAREVWSGAEVNIATIHTQISNLRKILNVAAPLGGIGVRSYIVTQPGSRSYSLTINDGQYDYARFLAAFRAGNTAREARDPEAAVTAYHEALTAWSDDARGLHDLAALHFADSFAEFAEKERQKAVIGRVEAELALGRGDILELERLAATWPHSREICLLLLSALKAEERGDQADQVYARFMTANRDLDESTEYVRSRWYALADGKDIGHYGGRRPPPARTRLRPGAFRTEVDESSALLRAELVSPSGVHDLAGANFIIGRNLDCDLTLTDPQTSRQHASITPTPAGFVLRDLGSTNGTFVDGKRVVGTQLLPRNAEVQIKIVSVTMTFRSL